MLISNSCLQWWFDRYNHLYFGGKLDPHIRASFKDIKQLGMATTIWFERPATVEERKRSHLNKTALTCYYIPRIYISKRLQNSDRLSITTLLHEMVHTELFQQDGRWDRKGACNSGRWNKFNKRMLELAKQGAFNGWW